MSQPGSPESLHGTHVGNASPFALHLRYRAAAQQHAIKPRRPDGPHVTSVALSTEGGVPLSRPNSKTLNCSQTVALQTLGHIPGRYLACNRGCRTACICRHLTILSIDGTPSSPSRHPILRPSWSSKGSGLAERGLRSHYAMAADHPRPEQCCHGKADTPSPAGAPVGTCLSPRAQLPVLRRWLSPRRTGKSCIRRSPDSATGVYVISRGPLCLTFDMHMQP